MAVRSCVWSWKSATICAARGSSWSGMRKVTFRSERVVVVGVVPLPVVLANVVVGNCPAVVVIDSG
eukprot:15891973-Heterocapsa_arctica.AAC.1